MELESAFPCREILVVIREHIAGRSGIEHDGRFNLIEDIVLDQGVGCIYERNPVTRELAAAAAEDAIHPTVLDRKVPRIIGPDAIGGVDRTRHSDAKNPTV